MAIAKSCSHECGSDDSGLVEFVGAAQGGVLGLVAMPGLDAPWATQSSVLSEAENRVVLSLRKGKDALFLLNRAKKTMEKVEDDFN